MHGMLSAGVLAVVFAVVAAAGIYAAVRLYRLGRYRPGTGRGRTDA